jgi:hypothetical protein
VLASHGTVIERTLVEGIRKRDKYLSQPSSMSDKNEHNVNVTEAVKIAA